MFQTLMYDLKVPSFINGFTALQGGEVIEGKQVYIPAHYDRVEQFMCVI